MYDALRYISKYYTVTNFSAAFDILQAPIPHITVYYICIHKLINALLYFVIVLFSTATVPATVLINSFALL